jgi:AcrR family transcriptional regulator
MNVALSCKRGRPKGSTAKQHIVDNAGAAFVKHGYHACTVEHILEETGVSRTNFYRFFKNKEAVFESIMREQIERLNEIQKTTRQTLQDEASAEEKLQIMFESYLNACFSLGDLMSIIFQEQYSLPELRKLREALLERFKVDIKKLLKEDGYRSPDNLLLEGCLAAVDRMVLVESLTDDSIDVKIAKVKDYSCQFTNLLLKN